VEVEEFVMRIRVDDRGWGLVQWAALGLGIILASAASAYPGGGMAGEKTKVGLYCAHCQSSTAVSDLEGTGEKATAELAENKHFAGILAGTGVYGQLSEADRARLVELLSAVDRNSTITLEAPAEVAAGATFQVKVALTGGAGPVVAVGLFDRPQRLFARPASTLGFEVLGWPKAVGGKVRRPADSGVKASEQAAKPAPVPYLVEIEGVSSSADNDRWAKVQVVFTLKAPMKAGDYPLFGAYLYGTEKAVKLSTRTDDPRFPPTPLGGATGPSGRVKFSLKQMVRVKAAP
jgi:hypothetical protein